MGALLALMFALTIPASVPTPVPPSERGTADAERSGFHDANNLRTVFWNYGMVGDYPADPGNVDLSVFHSAEAPKGSGMNYSDGVTPFVLAKIKQAGGEDSYIMETGFRERQGISPYFNRIMRFEPRPGYIQSDPALNPGRSPALSNDPRTWPNFWPDRLDDPDDPGWDGTWNGYFGKQIVADQESYTVMDDDYYDAWNYQPDSRDPSRHGLGLRIEVRGFQWANPQARNVIFWHYDITNESTTDYNDNIVFGLYMDSGVGGSALSCDNIYESDDDNAYFDRKFDKDVINLVYTWDKYGHGRDLSGDCGRTGYLGYAYLETPGDALDGQDNDEDGITDEQRDAGAGTHLQSQAEIEDFVNTHYNRVRFEAKYGSLANRPGYRIGSWWTGDEDMDWDPEVHDVGADGLPETHDTGERDGMPTLGEPNFDRTDLNESDQIGLTGFKLNRIKPGQGNPDQTVDAILFYTDQANWPERLFTQFSSPDSAVRFDDPLAANYNIGFLFASGPFSLKAGKTERFSLALAYGGDLGELRRNVRTVQQIYDANYRFAVPPQMPTLHAEAGDHFVRLSWDDIAERSADPVTSEYDFEGYRIYRSTDPEFRDPQVITTGTGSGPIGNGRPIAQFDLIDQRNGYSAQTVEGVSYYLGDDVGITHTFTDSTAVNGQLYYYAVTAYDYGSDAFNFYPSENAIAVSRTPRGGTVLPKNVVQVRPNPRVAGFVGASTGGVTHVSGNGVGTVGVTIVNSALVPDNHVFKISFTTPAPESLSARFYTLTDSTTGEILLERGNDFDATGKGPIGGGLLPLVSTPNAVTVDASRTGFRPGSPTNQRLTVTYQDVLPINLRRPGFPEDITIQFSDTIIDSSIASFPFSSVPAKFTVIAHGKNGDHRLDFRFLDLDGDNTLSRNDELIDIVTYVPNDPGVPQSTWFVQLNPSGQATPIQPPAGGDVFDIFLNVPFGAEDVFTFSTTAAHIDAALAANQSLHPYVVPNPYVGSASFEPERFAVSGRGERRMEFRGLPAKATVRIFTVLGELVQTLTHDGSNDGYVTWNLRTKDNLDVAPGLYIFRVEASGFANQMGKFAIIK